MHRYYKIICVECEKIVSGEKCPECGSQTYTISTYFRIPKKGNKDWGKIKNLINSLPSIPDCIPTSILVDCLKKGK